jgi:hypothetical protein
MMIIIIIPYSNGHFQATKLMPLRPVANPVLPATSGLRVQDVGGENPESISRNSILGTPTLGCNIF